MAKLTLNDIIIGGNGHPGLVPLVKEFLADHGSHSKGLQCYLNLIAGRASGSIKTNARFARDFVMSHPEYERDSVISERINYDLMDTVREMGELQRRFVGQEEHY